ncbi:trypsin-like serine peptidase [Streptomyces sp. NPDC086787]|uniref:trypsin-like serine peptidase n=1 Tax=Streptomyces sp. NPDC086787 TaxID=3365759 RepID=UPI0037FA0372
MGNTSATNRSRHSKSGRTGKRLRISVTIGAAIAALGAGSALACIDTSGGQSAGASHHSGSHTTKHTSTTTKSSTKPPTKPSTKPSSKPSPRGTGTPATGHGTPDPRTTSASPGSGAKTSAGQAFSGSARGASGLQKNAIGYLATDFDYRGTSFLPHYTQCSATAVAPDVIVTAAHCVVKSSGERAGDQEVFFRPGLDAARQPKLQEYFRSAKVLVDPRYRAAEGSWEHTAYDVAYVVMQKKNGRSLGDVAGWVTSTVDKALVGKQMTIVGYPETQADRYRPHVCGKSTRALEPNRGHGEAQVIWGTNTCSNLGDGASGGPWFAQSGGSLTLVGVNHGTFSRNGNNAAAGASFNDTTWRLFQSALRAAGDN